MVSGELRVALDAGEPAWDVAVGDRFLLAVPAGPGSAAVLAAARVPVQRLEDLIARIRIGEGGVEEFALVWWPIDDGRLTVVARGGAAVELTTAAGRRRLDAVGVRPWHLAEFHDVRRIRFGSVVAGEARWADASASVHDAPLRVTTLEWRSTGEASVTEPIATRSAVQAEAWQPESHEESEPASAQAAWFRVPGGEPREVTGVVLIGRRPAQPRIAHEHPVELVRVDPSAGAVSATHLELRRAGTRLVATDLRSTNGTVVRSPTGTRRMRAGESIVVAAGSVVELGGDTIVEILPPPQDQAHPDRQVPA
ncbi:FHA domain-containing protein [Agromyces silvae]|uniref:FHA domain-containing protein n=1 Tax=Agromyces silvae TaxID=3388266 RepID=UPI00280B388B|nr:FHA domain-containing protein [Agromyces protaetiae]